MYQFLIFTILISLFSFIEKSRADSLFYEDSCVSGETGPFIHTASAKTCQQIKTFKESTEVVKLALMPVSVAMLQPGVRAAMAAELMTLGLTLSNPAVVGVLVLGATGMSVFYIVMKHTMEECNQMEQNRLKEELLFELKRKYGLNAAPRVELVK